MSRFQGPDNPQIENRRHYANRYTEGNHTVSRMSNREVLLLAWAVTVSALLFMVAMLWTVDYVTTVTIRVPRHNAPWRFQ